VTGSSCVLLKIKKSKLIEGRAKRVDEGRGGHRVHSGLHRPKFKVGSPQDGQGLEIDPCLAWVPREQKVA
jgi:hypothetical protein